MRTSCVTVTGVLVLSLLAACTVKDVEPPSLAGPSTLARAITMTANKDTLFQNGVDFVDILITSTSPTGQSQTIPLRAEIMVGGVVQDFGTLNTKSPITPTTLRYTAPTASPLAANQVSQTITIAVTPTDSGDFRSEVARQLDLRLVPQGVILPTNPNLAAAFTVTPASPQAFSTASFNASTSTNGGVACGTNCSYAWNFGDGTTGSGTTTTHEFRTVGTYQVTLTLTDSRGAQATAVQTITVTASTPPTAVFVMSPTPVGINQDVFFNAEQSRATLPRTIVSYGWNFGDGRMASGVTVSRSFSTNGVYNIVLTVTDDAGAFAQATQPLTVATAGAGPTAGTITVSPTAVTTAAPAFFNASAFTAGTAPIVSYRFNYGDGTADDVGPSATQSHRFAAAGTYTVRVTATDSLGRTATTTVTVPVSVPGPVPSFSVTPSPAAVGAAVTFDATATTTTGTAVITSYTWEAISSAGTISIPSGQVTTKTFGTAGTYVITLTVTDGAGVSASTSRTVTVTLGGPGGPTPGTITVSPTPVTTNATTFFNASAFTAGTTPIATYRFNWGDNTADDVSSSPTQTHRFSAPGSYTVRVTATDTLGRTATNTVTVPVSAPGPVPSFMVTPSPAAVGAVVAFDATGTTTTGSSPITSYTWTASGGAGAIPAGQVTTKTFGTAGTYVITLTVTDGAGVSASTSRSVIIQ